MRKFRSSRPEMFSIKGILRNLAKFRRRHLCQSLFLNKVAGLRSPTLLKKRPWHRCFPVKIAKFLRTPSFTEHLWRLLLKVIFLQMLVIINHQTLTFPLEIFMEYCTSKKLKLYSNKLT